MDDEKEILYIALSNSLLSFKELLEEENNMPKEEKELIDYIINRHLELIDKYAEEISKSESNIIKRPIWDKLST